MPFWWDGNNGPLTASDSNAAPSRIAGHIPGAIVFNEVQSAVGERVGEQEIE